jgi:hypothetical protein
MAGGNGERSSRLFQEQLKVYNMLYHPKIETIVSGAGVFCCRATYKINPYCDTGAFVTLFL